MTEVVLVLAHDSDDGAASVAASVRSMLSPAAAPVEVWSVRPETLSLAAWSHSVDDHGRARTRLALPGRPLLESGQIRAIFNRIQHLPVPQFSYANVQDRDYAASEFQALVLSWLAASGERVVHTLRSQAWLTQSLPLLHWAASATRSGLAVAARDVGAAAQPWDATVLVAGTHTTGILARRLGAACLSAAQALGFTLLEFRFARRGDVTELVDVSPYPDLTDMEDIDAVARCIADLTPMDADA
ncbi:hypothetical protein [Rhodoferax sp.]|uniref:hypothetical protein n=1 Tax=Rhodoferax sp. TaxID=50421 RepID=UPI00374D7861